MSVVSTDQNYYDQNANFNNYSFERYEIGNFSHHAMRAFNGNQESYQIDIFLGEDTGSTGSSGGSALWTNNVNLRMFARKAQQMQQRYGNATDQLQNVAHLTPRLLLVTSACIFARYLNDANNNYNRFTNNCQHFCNDVIEALQAGEVQMPHGYQLAEDPVEDNGRFTFQITTA